MEMLYRWSDAQPRPDRHAAEVVFALIDGGATSSSPQEATPLRFLLPNDRSTMNRDRVLAGAKSLAIEMASGYSPPAAPVIEAAGRDIYAKIEAELSSARDQQQISPHSHTVGRELARVMCGGDVDPDTTLSEQAVFDLERQAFLNLARSEPTLARIEHTLATGKPLRN